MYDSIHFNVQQDIDLEACAASVESDISNSIRSLGYLSISVLDKSSSQMLLICLPSCVVLLCCSSFEILDVIYTPLAPAALVRLQSRLRPRLADSLNHMGLLGMYIMI